MRYVVICCLLKVGGCAIHTPEGATRRFIIELQRGVPQVGTKAFERTGDELHLRERRAKGADVYRRMAGWSKGSRRIALVSSNLLRDPSETFDLRLNWTPSRQLDRNLLSKLLVAPFGLSYTGDTAWVIDGGVLEYRAFSTETPYLLYSSPGYVKDPLDLVESDKRPRMPPWNDVERYLRNAAKPVSPERTELGGVRAQEFCLVKELDVCVRPREGCRNMLSTEISRWPSGKPGRKTSSRSGDASSPPNLGANI
ncbi:MAG TPA: hypothetical protein VKU01_35075 [Bryobacteraceae bacterium]|nr:hypothetical protein [Bryobacteraceae bacterium]